MTAAARPLPNAAALARKSAADLEAALMLGLLVLLGLIWLVIGASVMRGAHGPAPRAGASLQGRLADLKAARAD
jgi:hypothetical protein